jgi:hypothetical protein
MSGTGGRMLENRSSNITAEQPFSGGWGSRPIHFGGLEHRVKVLLDSGLLTIFVGNGAGGVYMEYQPAKKGLI